MKKAKNIINGNVYVFDFPQEVANADIVISFTHADNIFIKDNWIRPRTIVIPIGSYREI
jgi:ornithine cyclodeaminase/alanine dehydrogenase